MELSLPTSDRRIPPKLFALWVSFASIIMMFAGLTSAYIVRQGAGNWLEFPVPSIFLWSTIVILISSITLHFSYKAFAAGNETGYKSLLLVTTVLGLMFLVLQYFGWQALNESGISITGNTSGSFVYVISGIHAAHILGGIGALVTALVFAFKLKYFVSERRKLRFRLVVHYWHFVDVLWIYLFIFFMFQK